MDFPKRSPSRQAFASRSATLASAATLTLLLAGCAPIVALEPAAGSNDPGCAEIIVRLPDSIGELEKRSTNAQATGAWGNPVAVILRCGLEPATVSELPCVSVAGVDWLVDESQAPNYRFISFGRQPATEVIVDSTLSSGVGALESLSGAISALPPSKTCQ